MNSQRKGCGCLLRATCSRNSDVCIRASRSTWPTRRTRNPSTSALEGDKTDYNYNRKTLN